LNPHTNYLAVGFFLLLGVIVTVILVVWLGRAGDTTARAQYAVQIDREVNGLSNGSAVRFLGVNVGSVVSISLHADVGPHVDVVIEIQDDIPIDEATYATLVVQGVTGIANIDLGSDATRARPVVTNPDGLQVIPFRATGLSAALAGSGDIATDVRRLLGQLIAWTDEENLERIRNILANAESVSQTLAEQREEIPELVARISSTARTLERTAHGLESIVDDDWPVIAGDLKATSANLRSVSTRVDGWLAANDENVDRMLGEGLDAVSALVVDLRETADELTRLSARLREDPSRIIYRTQHDPVVAEP
jgi:phospholipid/cholesterol/gamma-HCH transport system substrate-binding protein